jgi:hypothetical protein
METAQRLHFGVLDMIGRRKDILAKGVRDTESSRVRRAIEHFNSGVPSPENGRVSQLFRILSSVEMSEFLQQQAVRQFSFRNNVHRTDILLHSLAEKKTQIPAGKGSRHGEPGCSFVLNHRFQRMRRKVWDYELLFQLCFEYLMLYGSPASQMTNKLRLMDDDLVHLNVSVHHSLAVVRTEPQAEQGASAGDSPSANRNEREMRR